MPTSRPGQQVEQSAPCPLMPSLGDHRVMTGRSWPISTRPNSAPKTPEPPPGAGAPLSAPGERFELPTFLSVVPQGA